MGKNIALVGDGSSHGGTVTNSGGNTTVDVSGILVAVHGASHSCPIPFHGTTSISACTVKTRINGKLVLTTGATAGCGASITPADRGIYVE